MDESDSMLANKQTVLHKEPANKQTILHKEPTNISNPLLLSEAAPWSSPVFLRTKKWTQPSSDSPLSVAPHTLLDDELAIDDRPRKKTKFWRTSGEWTYSQKTPSPARDELDVSNGLPAEAPNVEDVAQSSADEEKDEHLEPTLTVAVGEEQAQTSSNTILPSSFGLVPPQNPEVDTQYWSRPSSVPPELSDQMVIEQSSSEERGGDEKAVAAVPENEIPVLENSVLDKQDNMSITIEPPTISMYGTRSRDVSVADDEDGAKLNRGLFPIQISVDADSIGGEISTTRSPVTPNSPRLQPLESDALSIISPFSGIGQSSSMQQVLSIGEIDIAFGRAASVIDRINASERIYLDDAKLSGDTPQSQSQLSGEMSPAINAAKHDIVSEALAEPEFESSWGSGYPDFGLDGASSSRFVPPSEVHDAVYEQIQVHDPKSVQMDEGDGADDGANGGTLGSQSRPFTPHSPVLPVAKLPSQSAEVQYLLTGLPLDEVHDPMPEEVSRISPVSYQHTYAEPVHSSTQMEFLYLPSSPPHSFEVILPPVQSSNSDNRDERRSTLHFVDSPYRRFSLTPRSSEVVHPSAVFDTELGPNQHLFDELVNTTDNVDSTASENLPEDTRSIDDADSQHKIPLSMETLPVVEWSSSSHTLENNNASRSMRGESAPRTTDQDEVVETEFLMAIDPLLLGTNVESSDMLLTVIPATMPGTSVDIAGTFSPIAIDPEIHDMDVQAIVVSDVSPTLATADNFHIQSGDNVPIVPLGHNDARTLSDIESRTSISHFQGEAIIPPSKSGQAITILDLEDTEFLEPAEVDRGNQADLLESASRRPDTKVHDQGAAMKSSPVSPAVATPEIVTDEEKRVETGSIPYGAQPIVEETDLDATSPLENAKGDHISLSTDGHSVLPRSNKPEKLAHQSQKSTPYSTMGLSQGTIEILAPGNVNVALPLQPGNVPLPHGKRNESALVSQPRIIVEDVSDRTPVVEDDVLQNTVLGNGLAAIHAVDDVLAGNVVAEDLVVDTASSKDVIMGDTIVENSIVAKSTVEDSMGKDRVVGDGVVGDRVVQDHVVEDRVMEDAIVEDAEDSVAKHIVMEDITEKTHHTTDQASHINDVPEQTPKTEENHAHSDSSTYPVQKLAMITRAPEDMNVTQVNPTIRAGKPRKSNVPDVLSSWFGTRPETGSVNEDEGEHDLEQDQPAPQPSQVEAVEPVPSVATSMPRRRSIRLRKSNVPEVLQGWFESPDEKQETMKSTKDDATEDDGQILHTTMESQPEISAEGTNLPLANEIPNKATENTEEAQPSPEKAATNDSYSFRTPLSYYHALSTLPHLLNSPSTPNNTIDTLAIVTWQSKKPKKSKAGAKDYYTILHVAQPPQSSHTTEVHVFRPDKDVLPLAEKGDVVLLRSFVVKSRHRECYLLSGDASAWLVWRFGRGGDGEVVVEESRGAPVEVGEEERVRVRELREWWLGRGER